MSPVTKSTSTFSEHVRMWTVVLVWLAVAAMAAVVAHVVAAGVTA